MTISSITSRVSYPGAGSVGPYPFPFRIFAIADLLVTKRSSAGAETALASPTDFTLSAGSTVGDAAGAIDLTTALEIGETLVIRRAPALTQPASIQNQGAFFPKTHEDEFDRLVMQVQALDDRLRRSLSIAETFDSNGVATTLVPQPGMAIGFNGTGDGFETFRLDSTTVGLPANGRTVATLTAYLANSAVFNVKDFGAVMDGATDDTAAGALAIAAAIAAGGGIVYVPAGVFYGVLRVPYTAVPIAIVGAGRESTTIKQPAKVRRVVAGAGSMTAGSGVLTCPGAAFTQADVRKTVWVADAFTGSALLGDIVSVADATHCTLDRSANATVGGKDVRIGVGRSVIEINEGYKGALATAMVTGGVVFGLRLDGNRANVDAPVNAGDDLTNHGLFLTAASNWVVDDLRILRCQNCGIDNVITSNHNIFGAGILIGDYVQADTIGNGTTGMPGFDVNSSSYCQVQATILGAASVGFRLLDNCHGNVADVIVRQSRQYGVLLNNQVASTNTCRNNRVRATVLETLGAYGVGIGPHCHENELDLVVAYSGGTFDGTTFTPGVTQLDALIVGNAAYTDAQKPTNNRIRLLAANNCGMAAVIQGNYNALDIRAVNNVLYTGGALTAYAIELNGSWNDIVASFRDTGATQRGLAIRAAAGEAGTAARQNTIQLRQPNPTSPCDDTSANGGNNLASAIGLQITTVAADYVARTTDDVILVNSTAASRTVTLPTTNVRIGKKFTVKNLGGAGNNCIVQGESGTIDGAANKTWTTQYESRDFVFDGTNYQPVARYT